VPRPRAAAVPRTRGPGSGGRLAARGALVDDDPLYRLGHPVELVAVQRGVHHVAHAFQEDPEVVAGDAVPLIRTWIELAEPTRMPVVRVSGTATFFFDEGEVARSIGSPIRPERPDPVTRARTR